MSHKNLFFLLPFSLFLLFGCTGRYHFEKGIQAEALGNQEKALSHYKVFLKRRTAYPFAPEALARLGALAEENKDCPLARRAYKKILKRFSQSSFAPAARAGLLRCPDYFPLSPGSAWRAVDSDTGGDRYLALCSVAKGEKGLAEISKKMYAAGESLGPPALWRYLKTPEALWEYPPEVREATAILRFPVSEGDRWRATQSGQTLFFTVESTSQTVKTRAGAYPDCVKIRVMVGLAASSWRWHYYANDVGWVLTTQGGKDFSGEKRVMELAEAHIADED